MMNDYTSKLKSLFRIKMVTYKAYFERSKAKPI